MVFELKQLIALVLLFSRKSIGLFNTYRITGYKGEAQELLKIIKGKFFHESLDIELNGERVPPPSPLPWYPGELGWQINVAKSEIRKVEELKKLHKFMISEQVMTFFMRRDV